MTKKINLGQLTDTNPMEEINTAYTNVYQISKRVYKFCLK